MKIFSKLLVSAALAFLSLTYYHWFIDQQLQRSSSNSNQIAPNFREVEIEALITNSAQRISILRKIETEIGTTPSTSTFRDAVKTCKTLLTRARRDNQVIGVLFDFRPEYQDLLPLMLDVINSEIVTLEIYIIYFELAQQGEQSSNVKRKLFRSLENLNNSCDALKQQYEKVLNKNTSF